MLELRPPVSAPAIQRSRLPRPPDWSSGAWPRNTLEAYRRDLSGTPPAWPRRRQHRDRRGDTPTWPATWPGCGRATRTTRRWPPARRAGRWSRSAGCTPSPSAEGTDGGRPGPAGAGRRRRPGGCPRRSRWPEVERLLDAAGPGDGPARAAGTGRCWSCCTGPGRGSPRRSGWTWTTWNSDGEVRACCCDGKGGKQRIVPVGRYAAARPGRLPGPGPARPGRGRRPRLGRPGRCSSTPAAAG